mmetsp:Transcript_89613/g.178164  ORF Transcript_89613/g.178164 Transcript_89613/m.178164 type:complete len:257 (+) Transcript_89613:1026-1796(+)
MPEAGGVTSGSTVGRQGASFSLKDHGSCCAASASRSVRGNPRVVETIGVANPSKAMVDTEFPGEIVASLVVRHVMIRWILGVASGHTVASVGMGVLSVSIVCVTCPSSVEIAMESHVLALLRSCSNARHGICALSDAKDSCADSSASEEAVTTKQTSAPTDVPLGDPPGQGDICLVSVAVAFSWWLALVTTSGVSAAADAATAASLASNLALSSNKACANCPLRSLSDSVSSCSRFPASGPSSRIARQEASSFTSD